MATGRGRILQQHWLGLQTLRGPSRGGGAARGRARTFGFRRGPGVKCSAGSAALRCHARGGRRWESPFSCRSGLLDGMPSEILLKIFSYLDAVSLLCAGCVSRRFYHLANDNFIWIRIYSTAFSPTRSNWKVNSVEKIAVSVSFLSVQDKEAGYWKKEYITKQIASVKAALADILKPVNPYTGLPVKTKEALRMFGLGWAIILKEKSGKEYIMEHVDLSVNDTSVTVIWYGKNWPCLASLSTLDLCGVTPVFMDWYKTPTKHRLRWHSLIAKYNLSHLTVSTMIGCDRLIRIFCLHPGLLVGVWKKEEELAFVMANLHFHHLVERSTLGSATIPYELPPHSPFLDDSPEYGLHGYQLHVDLHSGGVFYLCGTFRNLFTKKGNIENGHVKLIVIHLKNNREHLPLIGKVGLSWKTDILDGCIKSCSMMDVTLLDEHGKPFWCFSSPVCMRSPATPADGPSFLGQTYSVDYVDAEGRVHVELVWIRETEEYLIVNLVLYLSIAKINRWFGTEY
ncbi:F-box only protein 15 isoform X1 [Papio anubis]|uniref:F-box only protein 15 n=1 Tax=Papio anubis TaxID=9555 RepID=A0A8I5MZ11_PAPAN|nr:F-box only protein 15 isoform X1 [Papio anubis]